MAPLRSKVANLKLKAWALRESEALGATWPQGSPAESRVLATWKANRPTILADLGEAGAAALAHVLVDRKIKAQRTYEKAGLPPTDAAEEAEKDWLLLEPEDESE